MVKYHKHCFGNVMQGRKGVAKSWEQEVDVLVRRHKEEAGAQAWMHGCQTSPPFSESEPGPTSSKKRCITATHDASSAARRVILVS